MNKTLYFLRSGSYDYIHSGCDLYASFDLVARHIVDPPLSSLGKDEANKLKERIGIFPIVISSPTRRSHETAQILGKKVIIEPGVREIEYSMSNFISYADFYDANGKPYVDTARMLFVRNFIANQLIEKYGHCMTRIQSLFDYLESLPDTTIAIVSHGFFLKVIESYCKNPHIAKDPTSLLSCFSGEKQTYGFCDGFIATMRNKEIAYERNI